MELTINHKLTFFEELPQSLAELVLQATQGNTSGVAVALNHQVIPKLRWSSTVLASHDSILIIKASQGG